MVYRFYTCDVFTERRFGGNPLAVLPEADGLSAEQMQQIAREFNYSETTFVLPPETGHTRRIRIFTPATEVPFAGHPNIGTAFILASAGELGVIDSWMSVTFEQKAGPVCISVQRRDRDVLWCELTAPAPFSSGRNAAVESVASAVSLTPDDIVTGAHEPLEASVGLPFLMVELKDRDALRRARIHLDGFEALAGDGIVPDVHLYVRSDDEFDIRARMFAPLDGVPEDPATGSANCALAGLLGHLDQKGDASLRWRIAQGMEMGRPSVLEASAEKKDGSVVSTRIGGTSVLVGEGTIQVG